MENKKHYFAYTLIIEDDCSSTGFYEVKGLGFAADYAEAMEYLQKFYNYSKIWTVSELTLLEDAAVPVFELPNDVIKIYKHGDYCSFCEEIKID